MMRCKNNCYSSVDFDVIYGAVRRPGLELWWIGYTVHSRSWLLIADSGCLPASFRVYTLNVLIE